MRPFWQLWPKWVKKEALAKRQTLHPVMTEISQATCWRLIGQSDTRRANEYPIVAWMNQNLDTPKMSERNTHSMREAL